MAEVTFWSVCIPIGIATVGGHALAKHWHRNGHSWNEIYKRGLLGSLAIAAWGFLFFSMPTCVDSEPMGGCNEYADDGETWTFDEASKQAVSRFLVTFAGGNIAFQILKRREA